MSMVNNGNSNSYNNNNINNNNTNNDDANGNPPCKCSNPSVQYVTRKPGPNLNRPFFTCAKPRSEQCGFFEWADKQNQPPPAASSAQHRRPQQPQQPPLKSATGYVWPTAVRGERGPNQNSATNNTAPNSSTPFNPAWPTAVRGVRGPNQNPPNNNGMPINSSAPFNQNLNPNGNNSLEPALKRPRPADPPPNRTTRLSVSLADASTVSIPVRVTAPQVIKDAVTKFSNKNGNDNKNSGTKKTVFGETLAVIPITKILQMENFIRAHAPGVEFDYDVPRAVLDQLDKFHNNEEAREASGDVVTRPLDEVLPSKLGSSLMEFQWHGVHFAMKRGGRCLIGDDMGLGKTIQAIAIARVYMDDWPLLIVCPSSLRLNWKEEIIRWLGDDVGESDVQVFMTGKDASKRLRKVNITSYDIVRKIPAHSLEKCQFVIADESHYLKSITAQRTKVVTPLVKRARRALLLSGTPALSRPVELFAQVNAIAPCLFPSYNEYVVRYCNARQTYWGFDVNGSSHLDELHTLLTGTILIRRKKDDVLTQLPEKVRQVTWVETKQTIMKQVARKQVEFEDAKAAASDAATPEEAAGLGMRVKGIQNELYALTADAKLESVLEFCRDTAESGCKFIVFAHHTKMIDALDQYVTSKLKLGLIRIDGGTPQADRQALCKKFQSDSNNCRVALLSITAAGVGLTLTKATVVLFAELYWNPGSLLQAEDRAHRIGQRNSILVSYLLAKKTLDESMWKTIRRKLTVVGQSLTGHAAKMDAEEGQKTDIGASSSSASRWTAGNHSDKSGDKKTAKKPFFPERKKQTQTQSDARQRQQTGRVSELTMNDDDDDDDDVGETQVNDEITIMGSQSNPRRLNQMKRKRDDDMFPPVVDLNADTYDAPADAFIDADLALARKLQQQYDAEPQQ